MFKICCCSLLFILASWSPEKVNAQFTLDSTVLDTTTIISGLDIPWEITWGPDDWIWVTERYGRVSRVHPENGTHDVILDISGDVWSSGEAGLLGMAIHPDVLSAVHVYLVYTYQEGFDIFERLVTYEYDGSKLVNPIILLDSITGNSTHDGSRLIISPDGYLFMTTGEAKDQPLSQDLNSLNGKILRFNTDGSIPADNPIPGSPIWSWGHRNPQGLVLGPNGILYSSEHGPQTDDELNIIQKGGNYGWPEVHGYCDGPSETVFCLDSSVIEPIAAWTPTIAPSDIIWYDHPAIPEWQGDILMAVLKDKVLIALNLNAAGDMVESENRHFEENFGRIRDICAAPDGRIFIATSGQGWVNSTPFTHKIIQFKNNSFVDTLTSIAEPSSDLGLQIFLHPNPVEDMLTIGYNRRNIGSDFAIYNVHGVLIKAGSLPDSDVLTLNLGQLPTGVYFVSFRNNTNVLTKKIIIRSTG